jgi:hypothetical protein
MPEARSPLHLLNEEIVACRKCRKRFELTGQSVVLVSGDVSAPGSADFDPETFGNR